MPAFKYKICGQKPGGASDIDDYEPFTFDCFKYRIAYRKANIFLYCSPAFTGLRTWRDKAIWGGQTAGKNLAGGEFPKRPDRN